MQSHLSSSRLVRLLRDWAGVEGESPRHDVAERLGEWLGAFDSVQLDGALQAIAAYRPGALRHQSGAMDIHGMESAFRRTKTELIALIDSGQAASARSGRGHAPPRPPNEPDPQADTDYARHHQRYLELQKQMAQKIAPCRALVRQGLMQGPPALRQLAALDGVMEQMLGPREQKLLASVPVYLERRFNERRKADERMGHASGMDDDPRLRQQAGGWLHAFEQDMRDMLRAEMHVRLQPIWGLMEAARQAHRELA